MYTLSGAYSAHDCSYRLLPAVPASYASVYRRIYDAMDANYFRSNNPDAVQ